MSAEPPQNDRKRLDELFRLTDTLTEPRDERSAQLLRLEQAEELYRQRRRREEIFGTKLFTAPALDIVLELYIDTLKRATDGSPPARATIDSTDRYMLVLEKQGMIENERDPADANRTRFRLTTAAITMLERFVDDGC